MTPTDARPHRSIAPAVDGLGAYPGRGLIVGTLGDGHPFLVYLVTGRSEGSLDRRATERPDGSWVVGPTTGDAHDDLRHYVAVVETVGGWMVGNGAQVEPLGRGGIDGLVDGLREWEAEPDPPIWTPRIVGAVSSPASSPASSTASPRALVGAARRSPGGGSEHVWLDVAAVPAGHGLRITTYDGDVDAPKPLAVPTWVTTPPDLDSMVGEMWAALDPARRVLLLARDLRTGRVAYVDRHR